MNIAVTDARGSDMTGELINVAPTRDGSLKAVPFETNAVLVTIYWGVDYEGHPLVSRAVSLLCNDAEWLPELRKEASRIQYGHFVSPVRQKDQRAEKIEAAMEALADSYDKSPNLYGPQIAQSIRKAISSVRED